MKKKWICLILAVTILFTGCANDKGKEKDKDKEKDTVVTSVKPSVAPSENANKNELSEEKIAGMTEEIMKDMTLEEKIGQLFMVNTELLDESKGSLHEFVKINDRMKNKLQKYPVGGVIFFARNIETRDQTKKFINDLQEASKIPLFISVDEEGGDISRIASNDNMQTTKFPTMEQIGLSADDEYVENMGTTIAKEIKELGFNVNFAPVADVKTNKLNNEIGSRSFGSDPKVVSRMVNTMVKSMQSQGISATLKHFPGQGNSSSDTHKGAVNIDNDINRLRKIDFIPFKTGIKAGVDFVMVSHISISRVTEDTLPASLSPIVLNDMLRSEMGFTGIIITDAMNMEAIVDNYTTEKAVVTSIKNGSDIILMPENLDKAFMAVSNAIDKKIITKEQIDASVKRIISTKIRRNVINEYQ